MTCIHCARKRMIFFRDSVNVWRPYPTQAALGGVVEAPFTMQRPDLKPLRAWIQEHEAAIMAVEQAAEQAKKK